MPIEVSWGNDEETLIVWKLLGRWEIEDFLEAVDLTRMMLDHVAGQVNVIVDRRRSMDVPAGLMVHARNAMKIIPQKVNLTIVIGASPLWLKLYGLMMQTYRGKGSSALYFVDTVDQAYSLVE